MRVVEFKNLGKNRKRRIVNDNVRRLVFFVFVISARIKWTNKILSLYSVLFANPRCNCLINIIRCITVVCCLLGFEFVKELVVFFVSFLPAVVVLFSAFVPFRKAAACVRYFKPGYFYVEPHRPNIHKFINDHVDVPVSELRQPVVCENVRSSLLLC